MAIDPEKAEALRDQIFAETHEEALKMGLSPRFCLKEFKKLTKSENEKIILDAIKEIAKLLGYYAAEKREHSGTINHTGSLLTDLNEAKEKARGK